LSRGRKNTPSASGQNQFLKLVIAALLPVTVRAGHNDIARNVQSDLKPVHAVQMLNGRSVGFQHSPAIAAVGTKDPGHSLCVF
jgi:hypothetical protein